MSPTCYATPKKGDCQPLVTIRRACLFVVIVVVVAVAVLFLPLFPDDDDEDISWRWIAELIKKYTTNKLASYTEVLNKTIERIASQPALDVYRRPVEA